MKTTTLAIDNSGRKACYTHNAIDDGHDYQFGNNL